MSTTYPSSGATIGALDLQPELIKEDITGLDVALSPEHTATSHVTVKGFNVVVEDVNGVSQVIDHPFLLGYPKNQDVIDCLPYFTKGNSHYIAVNHSIRPVVAARKMLKGDETDYLNNGKFTELMGIIFSPDKGDVSVGDTISRGAQEKLGAECTILSTELLGGSYFPSIGGTCESCMLASVKIQEPGDIGDRIIKGRGNFDAERKVSFMTPQQIVNGCLDGTIHDMRLLYATLQFAHHHHIALDLSLGIDSKKFTSYKGIADRTITASNYASKIEQCKQASGIHAITLEEQVIQPDNPSNFVRTQNLQVSNIQKTLSGEHYNAECLVRKTIDSVDVASYFRSDGKLYMVCKLGLRPGVLARNFLPHPLHASLEPVMIEGISSVKANGTPDIPSIVQGESGLATLHTQYLTSYFPSSGNNPEKVDLYVAEVNPSTISPVDQEFGVFAPEVSFIEVDSLIQMGEQGIVKDPRLLLQAQLLKQQFHYTNIDTSVVQTTVDPKLLAKAQSILLEPLQVDGFMKSMGAEAFKLHIMGLQKSPWYRKLVKYLEEDLGGFMATQDILLSETDKHFFDAMVPMFAVPSLELLAKYQNYYTHDGGHYAQGGILPYDPETDTRMDKETYCKMLARTEALAVFDSDYRFPLELGLEEFEATIGGNKSVVRSFYDLDISDPDEVRDCIVSIERDGIIPDKILLHSNYERNRDNIIDRVLRFYCMDHLMGEQPKGYDLWTKQKEFIKVALRFGNVTCKVDEFIQRMENHDKVVLSTNEGVNPLKAYVSRVLTRDIMLTALKYGMLKQMLVDNHGEEHESLKEIDQIIDHLYFCKQQIIAARDSVQDVSLSHNNLIAIATADQQKEIAEKFAADFKTYAMDTTLLNIDQIERLNGRTVPYFDGFAEMPEDLMARVYAKEKENLARVGK